MELCWKADYNERPDFDEVLTLLEEEREITTQAPGYGAEENYTIVT